VSRFGIEILYVYEEILRENFKGKFGIYEDFRGFKEIFGNLKIYLEILMDFRGIGKIWNL
jgi:hypothetical protein